MAGGDRTGPEGRGPLTGRGLGYCAGGERPGYVSAGQPGGQGYGRGCGWGFGRGRGYGRGFGSRHGFGFGGARRFNPADDVDLGVDPRNSVLPAESAVTRLLVEQIARLKDQVHALEARLAGPEPKE